MQFGAYNLEVIVLEYCILIRDTFSPPTEIESILILHVPIEKEWISIGANDCVDMDSYSRHKEIVCFYNIDFILTKCSIRKTNQIHAL